MRKVKKFKEQVKSFWNDEDGIGIIEILLIVAVIIGIALIFKDQITAMINKIFKKNNEELDEFLG
jgi:Flp pilus assembly pilin Flp